MITSEQIERWKRELKTWLLSGQTLLDRRRLRQMPSAKRVVVFLGDSRAKSWPVPPLPADAPPTIFFNRGIGFDMSARVLRRLDAHVTPLRPDIAVVQVGVNDLMDILLEPENGMATIVQCQANIERIVNHLHARKTHVILSTIFPVANITSPEDRSFWGLPAAGAVDPIAAAIVSVNGALRSLHNANVTLFDAHAVLRNERGFLDERYMADGLHLNATGYAVLNEHLTDLLHQRVVI